MMFRSPRDIVYVQAPEVYRKYDKTTEQYGCDICTSGGWTSETEVEIHKSKVHYRKCFVNEMRKRDDYCYICIKKCPNKESVVKHIRTEHLLSTETCLRVEREIYICDKCSSIFFNKQNLHMHLCYAHLNMRNMQHIKCVICMKKIQVRSMPAHFYSHGLQSVATCRICICKYYDTRALAEHLKTHPYYLKCDICCYEFSRVEVFHNHILSNHKNSVKMNSMKDTKINKSKLMGIKKKGKKKITTESATAVESDSNLMTVIEISDQDVTPTDTAANTNLTDNVNHVQDLVPNDITVTEVNKESDPNLTDNIKPIKDLMSNDVIRTKANTDNVVSKPVKDSEDFKRFFVPNSPTFMRLQRIVGIRGMRLSNDVHICVLCREICVGFEEMRSHVDEHKVIVEKSNSFECSCGEKFTFKLLLKHHALKSKHVISKLTII